MHKILMLNLLALFTVVLVSGGCSNEPCDEMTLASEVETALKQAIKTKRERFRSLPGRTGILAEERQYSVFAEELIIRDFFQDRKGGFFVDVGCAWPITGSNTYYFEKHLGWTGIGIDALDDYAADWEDKRPKSKFFSFLVTDRTGGSGTFFKSPGLGLSSTSRDMASGGIFGKVMKPIEIEVPMTTLDDLLDREGIEKIDLISMDIEGHEPKALAGLYIERFQPELLVIEGHSREVETFYSNHGYEQIRRYIPFDHVNRYFRRKQIAAPSGA